MISRKNSLFNFSILLLTLFLSSCGGGGGGGDATNGGGTTSGGGDSTNGGSGNVDSNDNNNYSGPYGSIKGTLTYESVPTVLTPLSYNDPNSGVKHIKWHLQDYENTQVKPIRLAKVKLINKADGNTVATTTSNEKGEYHFTQAQPNKAYTVRVYASAKSNSATFWRVRVVDNTQLDATYVLESPQTTVSANATSTVNLHAKTGATPKSLPKAPEFADDKARKSAPFSLLDTYVETLMQLKQSSHDLNLPQITIHWSTKNTTTPNNATTETEFDEAIAEGKLGGTFVMGNDVYVLGDKYSDTDEYDQSVLIHEFGHILEKNASRIDSIGGQHGLGDLLDLRLAFSEGFANALSGIIQERGEYVDIGISGQSYQSPLAINLESYSPNDPNSTYLEAQGNPNFGWWSERSIELILYDLMDTHADVFDGTHTDDINLGLQSVMKVMTGFQKNASAYTSLFTFMTGFKKLPEAQNVEQTLNAMLSQHNINAQNLDPYGSGQSDAVLEGNKIHTRLTLNQPTNVCFKGKDDRNLNNGVVSRRLLYVDLPTTKAYLINFTNPSNVFALSNGSSSDVPVPYGGNTQSTPLNGYILFEAGVTRIEVFNPQGIAGCSEITISQ